MALIIKPTEEKKITILGTEIELPSVYGRLEFAGRADGRTMEIAIANYASKEAFKANANQISTNVPQGSMQVQIEENEMQTIEVAHKYAKLSLKQEGYEVEIDLV